MSLIIIRILVNLIHIELAQSLNIHICIFEYLDLVEFDFDSITKINIKLLNF